MSNNNVIAILVSDIHLSHIPPLARSVEKDWYGVMEKYLDELHKLCYQHSCPLLCAGDIFDQWNSPPELINMALRCFGEFPQTIYTIPGQHDLPYHNLEDIKKTAYWSLVEAGVIEHLYGGSIEYIGTGDDKMALVGLPWASKETEFAKKLRRSITEDYTTILIMHKYVWSKKWNRYPGASDWGHAAAVIDSYPNYDIIHTGDNHKSFSFSQKGTTLINCGSFMRRTTPEINHKPIVGLLYQNGEINRQCLNTNDDQFLMEDLPISNAVDNPDGMNGLIKELNALQGHYVDFEETVKEFLHTLQVSAKVRDVIFNAIKEGSK